MENKHKQQEIIDKIRTSCKTLSTELSNIDTLDKQRNQNLKALIPTTSN